MPVAKNNLKPKYEKIDMRTPRMFSDESFEEKLSKAQKISDLKNLGPTTEKGMQKAGIKTLDQFVKMGWKKAMIKLVAFNPKNRHSMFAYALIGALKNVDAFHISEDDKKEAREFCASLKPKTVAKKKIKSKK